MTDETNHKVRKGQSKKVAKNSYWTSSDLRNDFFERFFAGHTVQFFQLHFLFPFIHRRDCIDKSDCQIRGNGNDKGDFVSDGNFHNTAVHILYRL